MWRSFLSEQYKLRRPAMLLGGGGTIVAFTVLSAVLALFAATNPSFGGGDGDGPSFVASFLSSPAGLAQGLTLSATFVGVVALGVFATSIASEYTHGTLRSLLVRQPRRLSLLGGKLLALAAFTVAAVAVAMLAAFAVGLVLGPLRGIDTSGWLSADGLQALSSSFFNVAASSVGWGALGALLALVLRSPAPAIGAGIAYALPVELLLTTTWSGGASWLPVQAFQALASGGSEALSYQRSLLMVAVYAAVALAVGAGLFLRRDVTT